MLFSSLILTGFAKDNSPDKQIVVINHDVTAPYAHSEYSEIILCDELKEKYPNLAKTIDDINTDVKNDMTDFLKYYGHEFEFESDFEQRTSIAESTVKIERADDSIFSICYDYFEDICGAAHPNGGSHTYNIDVKSGDILNIGQVSRNSQELTQALADQILKEKDSNIIDYLLRTYDCGGDLPLEYYIRFYDIEFHPCENELNRDSYIDTAEPYNTFYDFATKFVIRDYNTKILDSLYYPDEILSKTMWIKFFDGIRRDFTFDDYLYSKCESVLNNEYLAFMLAKDGLIIAINDYDISTYAEHATGDFLLSYSDYPDLINKKYLPNPAEDYTKSIEYQTVKETITDQ